MKKNSFWSRLSLVTVIVCVFALSATAGQYGDFTYTANDANITIIGYTGSGGAVDIPSTIDGKQVTSIGNNAFQLCRSLTSITIPDSVVSIGDNAFWNCTGLTDVMIGRNVTSIGSTVFDSCTALALITVDASNSSYSSADGVLLDKNQTTLIRCPQGKIGDYAIPDSVTIIANSAFVYCDGLTGVTIPDGLTGIGVNAFVCCASLTSITIPDSVVSIGDNAFWNCTGLTDVMIGKNVTSIGSTVFDSCTALALITVDASNSSYSSADGVLLDKNQTTLIRCPQGKIGDYAIPDSVTIIANSAFVYCDGLTGVTIPDGLTGIGVNAFVCCASLSSITIPDSVVSIGGNAFWNCKDLVYVIFLGNAPSMGSTVFDLCADNFMVYFIDGALDFTSPTWKGYPSSAILPTRNILCVNSTGITSIPIKSTSGHGGTTNYSISAIHGATVSLTVPDIVGMKFIGWTGNLSSSLKTITFPMNAAKTITANFAHIQATLTMAKTGSGTVTPPSGLQHTATAIPIKAVPANGYRFINWTKTGYASIADINAAETTVTLTAAATVTANFAQNYNSLTISKLGTGTTSPVVGTSSVKPYMAIPVSATPAANWHFVNWTLLGAGTIVNRNAVSTTVTLTGANGEAAILQAEFLHNTANLTVGKNGNGTAGFTGENPLNTATAIPITAIADADNHFVNWTLVSGSATFANAYSASTTVKLNGGHGTTATIRANFATGKGAATVTLGSLSQKYNGSQRQVSVATVPAELKVNITYAGNAEAPVNAGSYPVTATVEDANYIGTKTGTLLIAKASQAINFPALPVGKVFGDEDFELGASASSGLTPVTYLSSNPLVATVTAEGKLHIAGAGAVTITAKQLGDTNWNAAPVVSRAMTIAKKAQTIDFAAFSDHAMGDADFAPATASSGLPVTYASANPAVAAIIGGKIHIVGKGSSVITATQAGNANWSVAAPVKQTLTVAMGTQVITFNAIPNKAYGIADFAPGATSSSGLPLIYTSNNSSVATIVSGKIHITGVGTATITAKQAGNVKWYPAADVEQTLTVEKGTPVITWTKPAPITYGTPLSATQLNATANVPGKFTYTPVSGEKLPAGAQTLNADFTPTDAAHYNNANKSMSLTVNRALATVTITALAQSYTGTPRPVTVTTLPAGLKVDTTYNGSADAPTAIGSYAVLATVNDLNGTGTKAGTLVISKGVQTITFPAPPANLVYGDADCELTATAFSGLPVNYASSNPAVATITEDGKLHIVGAGTATITATQPGNSNWNAAAAVAKTISIAKKSQSIDFPMFTEHAKGDSDFAPRALADSGLPVVYTSANLAVATIVGGKIHIVGNGTVIITATQAGNANWLAALPVKRTLTVNPAVISNGVKVDCTSLGAGATTSLATFNLDMAGGRALIATPTISSLTFGPAPEEYWGKNHSLHVNLQWKVLVDEEVIATFQQTAEQNIIQLQAFDGPTAAGSKAITLQAVNSSYWSLDDASGDTTPVGTNNFNITFTAMEFGNIASDGVKVDCTSLGANTTKSLATLNLDMAGGRSLIATPTISSLTFGPAPDSYGGKNHSLHVNVQWKVLVDEEVIATYSQTTEQNIIQLQAFDGSTAAGSKAITLQAVNSSYWSLDDGSGEMTPVGTNNFNISFTAMELGDIVSDEVKVDCTSLGAGATKNLATFNLIMVGNRELIAAPTISSLTFGPAPDSYGGKNHSLHVSVQWNVLHNGEVIATFQQTAEQNIIQLQAFVGPTTAGSKAVTLQAVNSSYWSLDDGSGDTTPVGTNNFNIRFSAMELECLQ